jgi:hypothetical protein
MLKELLDAIARVFFGHNAVENAGDWKQSHDKAAESQKEVDEIIAEAKITKKG